MKPLQISFRFCVHPFSHFHSCHCTLPHIHPATEFLLNTPCTVLFHYIRGKKSPNQQNWSNLKSNFNLLSHGKKSPNRQQILCFSQQWVLRDVIVSLLTFPPTPEIGKLSGKDLYWYTTFDTMFLLKDKTKNRLSLLQQSLKLSCNCSCIVVYYLIKL